MTEMMRLGKAVSHVACDGSAAVTTFTGQRTGDLQWI